VPRLHTALVKGIDPPPRYCAQIESGRPEAANIAHSGKYSGEYLRLLGPACGGVAEPGGDERLRQLPCTGAMDGAVIAGGSAAQDCGVRLVFGWVVDDARDNLA